MLLSLLDEIKMTILSHDKAYSTTGTRESLKKSCGKRAVKSEGGSQHFFWSWVKKRVEKVQIRLSCEFAPVRGTRLEITVNFRKECTKLKWRFRGFGTWQTTDFFVYWILIGPKSFAANLIRRFQQTRSNQFWVSDWSTRDSKSVFFGASDGPKTFSGKF